MEGTPQKPKSCRFCRVRSFSGSHFQGPCGFPGFPALGQPKWREPHKSPKVESAPFPEAISKAPVNFWISGFWDRRNGGNSQKRKSCRFCRVRSFSGSHFQGPCRFPGFLPLGPPKWREPHKSPIFVDFVQSAPFPEPFPAPVDFLDFRLLGPPKWRNPTKAAKSSISQCSFLFRKPFPWLHGFF